MASRKHLVAVNRTIKAEGLAQTGRDAAIVELARDCARLLDAAGPNPPLNLIRAYQSALKDLLRASERAQRPKTRPRADVETEANPGPAPAVPTLSALDALLAEE